MGEDRPRIQIQRELGSVGGRKGFAIRRKHGMKRGKRDTVEEIPQIVVRPIVGTVVSNLKCVISGMVRYVTACKRGGLRLTFVQVPEVVHSDQRTVDPDGEDSAFIRRRRSSVRIVLCGYASAEMIGVPCDEMDFLCNGSVVVGNARGFAKANGFHAEILRPGGHVHRRIRPTPVLKVHGRKLGIDHGVLCVQPDARQEEGGDEQNQ